MTLNWRGRPLESVKTVVNLDEHSDLFLDGVGLMITRKQREVFR